MVHVTVLDTTIDLLKVDSWVAPQEFQVYGERLPSLREWAEQFAHFHARVLPCSKLKLTLTMIKCHVQTLWCHSCGGMKLAEYRAFSRVPTSRSTLWGWLRKKKS